MVASFKIIIINININNEYRENVEFGGIYCFQAPTKFIGLLR